MCDQVAAVNANTPDLSIETEEENKLRSKYPMLGNNKAGVGSMLLQKRLNKGHRFFDSGDYNMAMAKYKMKGAQQPPSTNLPSQSEEPCTQAQPPQALHDTSNVTSNAESSFILSAQPIQVMADLSGSGKTCVTSAADEPHMAPLVLSSVAATSHQESLCPSTVPSSVHRHSIIPDVHPVEGAAALILQEATGDTIPTPENVPAVIRKKSLFAAEEILLYQQHHQKHIEQQAEAVKLLEERLMSKPLSPVTDVEAEN